MKWNKFEDKIPSVLDLFNQDKVTDFMARTLPAINIREEEDSYIVTLAIPGVKKEDCRIYLDDRVLTVFSEKEKTDIKDDDKYSRYQYNFDAFSRSFSLPDSLDTDLISANLEDGELKIILAKKEVDDLDS